MKRSELEAFTNHVNKEIMILRKTNQAERLSELKEIVYILGISINHKKYSWADGFKRFCDYARIRLED